MPNLTYARFAQYKKLSVCAELHINVMCKEVHFLFIIIAFICGVLTVKPRPSRVIASSRLIFTKPFCRCKHQGLQSLINIPKALQLGSGRAGTATGIEGEVGSRCLVESGTAGKSLPDRCLSVLVWYHLARGLALVTPLPDHLDREHFLLCGSAILTYSNE